MDAIRRSRAGDTGAFAEVFDQYKNLVYRTAYLMLGDAHDAEDALQDVFWQVYRALSSYDPAKGAFTTWLHRITVNYCLNRQRRDRVGVALHDDHWDPAPGFASPEHLVESDDSLHRMLGTLSEKQRAVVVLRFVWDLSYDEIAQILDIPLGTVQSRLHGALKAVRARLAEGQTITGNLFAGEGSDEY
jgi:RNA polymerase sigma-70 factor (ECF subfamily)